MKLNMNQIQAAQSIREEVAKLREAAMQFLTNLGKASGNWDDITIQREALLTKLRSGEVWYNQNGDAMPIYKPVEEQLAILKDIMSEIPSADIESLYRQSLAAKEAKMLSSGTQADRQAFEVDAPGRTEEKPGYANSAELRIKRIYSELSGVEKRINELERTGHMTKNDMKLLNSRKEYRAKLLEELESLEKPLSVEVARLINVTRSKEEVIKVS